MKPVLKLEEQNVSIRKTLTVEAPQERAFRVFTESFDSWWPRGHHIGKADLKQAVIEPRTGGRWFERGVDGSECDWGKVLAWEPPSRLVISWQLTADWRYDPNFVTEVEVRFIAEGVKRTRVEFEHRNLERYGAALAQVRKSIDSEGGWDGILARYVNAANAGG